MPNEPTALAIPESRNRRIAVVSLASSLAAFGVHVWVGWMDERRIVLHPVGHGVLLALLAWGLAITIGLVALIVTRRRPWLAVLSLGISIGGLTLLFTK